MINFITDCGIAHLGKGLAEEGEERDVLLTDICEVEFKCEPIVVVARTEYGVYIWYFYGLARGILEYLQLGGADVGEGVEILEVVGRGVAGQLLELGGGEGFLDVGQHDLVVVVFLVDDVGVVDSPEDNEVVIVDDIFFNKVLEYIFLSVILEKF